MHLKTMTGGVVPLVILSASCHAAFTFDDIELWAGSGENRAAIVIDWNNDPGAGPNPVSLAWGYRWDGDATGQDMLTAVINADPNLYARFASFGFGDAVVGLGYDLDGDGFAVTDGTDFGATGLAFAGTSDGVTATDADDQYAEGWTTAFWSYSLGVGDPFDGGSWEGALIGFGDRTLGDGDWDGWRFAPGFVSADPREPIAAIPGPAGLAVLLVGLHAASPSRRRRGTGPAARNVQ